MEVSRYDDISQVMWVPQNHPSDCFVSMGERMVWGSHIFGHLHIYIYICIHIYIYIYGPEIFFGSRRSRVGIITSKNWGYQWVSQHPMIHEVQHRDGYDWGNPPKKWSYTQHMSHVGFDDGWSHFSPSHFLRVLHCLTLDKPGSNPAMGNLTVLFRLGQGCATHVCSHVSVCLGARLWYIFGEWMGQKWSTPDWIPSGNLT